jgi:hypothetical protein
MTTEDWNWIRPEGVIDFEFFLSKHIAPTTKKNVRNFINVLVIST